MRCQGLGVTYAYLLAGTTTALAPPAQQEKPAGSWYLALRASSTEWLR
jgi:hypothetical protein